MVLRGIAVSGGALVRWLLKHGEGEKEEEEGIGFAHTLFFTLCLLW